MTKYLSFDEFKKRYEKTTKMNGLGRIKNVELKIYNFYGDESTIEILNYR